MLIVSPEFVAKKSWPLSQCFLVGGIFFMYHGLMEFDSIPVPNVWLRPDNQRKDADAAKQMLTVPDGDHLTLLNVFNEYQSSMSSFALTLPILVNGSPLCRLTRSKLGTE